MVLKAKEAIDYFCLIILNEFFGEKIYTLSIQLYLSTTSYIA